MKIVSIQLLAAIWACLACQAVQAQHFYFAMLVDRTPYVIVDDREALFELQRAIIGAEIYGNSVGLEKDAPFTLDLRINNQNPPTEIDIAQITAWPLSQVGRIPGILASLEPGNRIALEAITTDGSGIPVISVIDQLFYATKPSLLVRCKPIADEEDFNHLATNRSHRVSPLIASQQSRRQDIPPLTAADTLLPVRLQSLLDSLGTAEYAKAPQHYRDNNAADLQLSSQVFSWRFPEEGARRQKDGGRQNKTGHATLYALMASYLVSNEGHGYAGTLLICDAGGKILYRSEANGYYLIHGISDTDRDGNHELIINSGSEWRTELILLQIVPQKDPPLPPPVRPMLDVKLIFRQVLPWDSGDSC